MSKADSSTSQTTTILPRSRGERGTGTIITIDLADYPDLLTQIRDAARVDDREPSKWLRRKIVQFSKCLMPGDAKPILFSALAVKEPERHPPANPPGERATTGL